MKSISKELWELSKAVKSVKELDNDEVVFLYRVTSVLLDKAEIATEKLWAEQYHEDIKKEVQRRQLDVRTLYVSMDYCGNFLKGREELKRLFLSMDFEDMNELVDSIKERNGLNDMQYQSLLNLECEVVKES